MNNWQRRSGDLAHSTSRSTRCGQWALYMRQAEIRRNVELPLLNVISDESEYGDKIVVPLPSAHLPEELRTVHTYGMQLDRPVHNLLMEEAIARGGDIVGEVGGRTERAYGHLVHISDGDSLTGAIGCAAEILMHAPSETTKEGDNSSPIMTVLARGSYRFIVKKVLKSFPYPVAIVDELIDDDIQTTSEFENGDEEDEEDIYATLDAAELVKQTILSLQALVKQRLSEAPSELSPLEVSILQSSGLQNSPSAQKSQAEEMAAVLDVFVSSIADICPMPADRYYSVAMLAAEIANLDNDVRRRILKMTDGVARLRIVAKHVLQSLDMGRARKMANSITDEQDESLKDLKVGNPILPPWAKQIVKGNVVEYFWNEEYGWCRGEVAEPPVQILDEIIITIRFDDGEIHKLPFSADEKARWRPATE